jgi:hypothetical protein
MNGVNTSHKEKHTQLAQSELSNGMGCVSKAFCSGKKNQ